MSDRREPPAGAARPVSFWRKTYLDPVLLVLVVLSIGLAVWGAWRAATDPSDDGGFVGFLLMGTAIIPTAWSVLRVVWSEDASVAIIVALFRSVMVPLAVCWPPAIATAVTVHLPVAREQIAATQGEDGWRYFFGERDGSLIVQTLVMGGLLGLILGILVGLVLSVFVVLPILAWFRPLGAAKSNMLLTETKEDQRVAKSSIRMLSVILMMAFGIPTLMIFGREERAGNSVLETFANVPRFFVEPDYYYGDVMFVVGLLGIPFGIWLVIWLKRTQRPDLAKRAEYGVNALDDRIRWQQQQQQQRALDQGSSEASAAIGPDARPGGADARAGGADPGATVDSDDPGDSRQL